MTMLRPTEWIAQHLGVLTVYGKPCQGAVRFLGIDTRSFVHPSETLFFALTGVQRDGHDFLEKAYKLGVRNFVVSKKINFETYPAASFFLVKDTKTALQNLATAHRKELFVPTIAITGSNGKTIVKEWLFHLLEKNFNIVRSPGSYNSQIGVPLSIWQIDKSHELALIEAGISEQGEMQNLSSVIQPDIGIFTNIGSAHEAGFSSVKQKVNEKMLLFQDASVLIYSKDYTEIHEAALLWEKGEKERIRKSWTLQKDIDAELSEVSIKILDSKNTLIRAKNKYDDNLSIRIPFSDKASIENALTCWITMRHLGLSQRMIRYRMRTLPPIEMRLEFKAGIHRCTLLNDSYNNDLTSLEIILAQAAKQANQQSLTLILSDILQNKNKDLYKSVANLLDQFGFTKFIGIGSEVVALQEYIPNKIDASFFNTTSDFLEKIYSEHFDNELIVIKGARPFAFERIARRLEQRAHRTVLEVNLSALRHNLNVYRRCLNPNTKILVMVKAAGYGSGSEQVARLLEYQGVDYLGVAYADEGIELRKQGVTIPILVLNTDPSGFDALLRYKLEPEVFSIAHLEEIIQFCKKGKKKIRIHLKIETGMNRLGFVENDSSKLIQLLCENKNLVEVVSVFSHLAGSDAANFDAFTKEQAKRFEVFSNQIIEGISHLPNHPKPFRHLVNTGGIVRHPKLHFDMVRLGIGIYGVEVGTTPEALQTVNSLKATISQIRTIQKGDTVGYNRSGKLSKASRIATVSIGYADGLLRLAGNGNYSLWIHGKLAPIVGNVCMDMCMLDVSKIPTAQVGDEVEVFGVHLPVEALAKALQTIPYEVFTNISQRVPRLYLES